LCGEKVEYGDRDEWVRAKKKERLRKHDVCKVERREERERERRDRMFLISDVGRLRGIEKALHEGWARRVKERDGMRCVACGEGGGEMHAHHVQPVCLHPSLCLHVPNGVTLCRECHLGEGGVHGRGEAGEVVLRLRGTVISE
jgi:thymidylate synthase (FAD)